MAEEYPTISPAKFYGSSLPRPYLYADVKFNAERVDPPVPVGDPFLLWAQDAHWKMGGLNVERRRMQGKVEGNIKKLREQKEKDERRRNRQRKRTENAAIDSDDSEVSEKGEDSEPEEVKKVEEEEEEEVIVGKRAVVCRRSKRLRKLAEYSEEE
ncbi:hypothetical protein EJ110_NYTH13608 [Nymphaea thermarum]|nr:hypothetical protein EJ110_NYTH13608 [Nymphaea thermarum]